MVVMNIYRAAAFAAKIGVHKGNYQDNLTSGTGSGHSDHLGIIGEGHNMRGLDIADQMATVAAGLVGKRLLYRQLIADNGLDSGARS